MSRSRVPDQTSLMPICSPPTMLTQAVGASYIIPLSSLMTILKELTKVKHTNHKLKKNIQTPLKPSYMSQPAVT